MAVDPRAVLSALTPTERAELDALLAADPSPWHAMAGPQTAAANSPADIVGYGGAAGGGKTDLLLGLALTQHRKAIIFRQNGTELFAVRERLRALAEPRGAVWNGHDNVLRWTRPSDGAPVLIELGSFPNPGDALKYQGRDHDLIGFDEASNMRRADVVFLQGWLRTTIPKQRTRVVLTFNPPMDPEGRWIVEYFAPWLDPLHPRPAYPGELRYFATVGERDIEVADARPFVLDGERIVYEFDAAKYTAAEIIEPLSRTFFPSKVGDNAYLARTNYVRVLQGLPAVLRDRLLHGSFSAGMRDDPFQVIYSEWVKAAVARWKPHDPLPEMQAMGVDVAMGGDDEHVTMARHAGYWFAPPIASRGREVPDGHASAALVLAAWRDRAVIHVDAFGVGAQTFGALAATGVQVLGIDFGMKTAELDATGVLRFSNLRSLYWWRMRELLDPASNTGIALPPHPKLIADLCAPKWKVRDGRVCVESREELVKKLGRSPDYGTAAVLAAIDTPKREVIAEMARMSRAGGRGRGEYDPFRLA